MTLKHPQRERSILMYDVCEKLMNALQADNAELPLAPTERQWAAVYANVSLLNETLDVFDGGWSDDLINAIAEADEQYLKGASSLEHLPFMERYHYQLLDQHLTAIINDALDRKKQDDNQHEGSGNEPSGAEQSQQAAGNDNGDQAVEDTDRRSVPDSDGTEGSGHTSGG